MSIVSQHIIDFSATMGMALDLAEPAHLAVEIDEVGTLHLEEQGESLVLYLSREIALTDDRPAVLRRALESVHYNNGLAEQVAVGLAGDRLVFLTRFHQHAIDRPRLEAAVGLLTSLQDEVRA
ncbi:MAG: hypothetical protein AAGG47_01605 [Pseudomonadota bacterium]